MSIETIVAGSPISPRETAQGLCVAVIMLRMLRAFLTIIVLLGACGPKGDDDTSDTGDGSASSPTSGATTTTGEAPTTGGPLTSGDTANTGVDLCEDPSPPVGPGVEIRIRNAGDALVYVDFEIGCQPVQPFKILGADAAELKVDLGVLEFTCSESLTGGCGADPGCPVGGRVVQIDPGGTYVASWSGGAYEVAPIPEQCADKFCDPCWAQQQVPAGGYTVRVASSGSIAGCDEEEPCTICEADAVWCIADGTRVDEIVVEGIIEYPGQSSIELVIP